MLGGNLAALNINTRASANVINSGAEQLAFSQMSASKMSDVPNQTLNIDTI